MYSALSLSSDEPAQPRSAALSIASRTSSESLSAVSSSAMKPHTAGSPAVHTAPSFLQSARGRAVTGAVRSIDISCSEGSDTVPMQLNISPASSAAAKHMGSLSRCARTMTI